MKSKYWTLVLIFVASLACSHGTADNHLQIMVVDDRIKMNIVVDMRVLAMADADKDGYASLMELAEQSQDIKDWLRYSIDVTDDLGNAGQVVFSDITSDLNIARANGDRVDHARILQFVEFSEALTGLTVDLSQLARVVPELRVTIIDAASGKRYKLPDPRDILTIRLSGN